MRILLSTFTHEWPDNSQDRKWIEARDIRRRISALKISAKVPGADALKIGQEIDRLEQELEKTIYGVC